MLSLALPVAATYLGLMFMGIVDLVCVGRLDSASIGAVGLGTALFSWVMVFGIGLLAGLDYLVSFAEGAGRPEDGHRALIQSLLASSVISLPLTLGLTSVARHLGPLGVDARVSALAAGYLGTLSLSLWPILVFSACRQYLAAQNVAGPALIILCVANALNVLANWVFVFGHWGSPRLGVSGSAAATLFSRTVMMLMMAAYLWLWDRRRGRFFSRVAWRLEPEVMGRFLRLGLPSALQMVFEVGVFALATTLAARLAPAALAAHQIVLNIASLTFMVPLGVSQATAVRVGQARGRNQPREAVRMGWRGLSLGVGYMACSGIALFLAARPILSIFTSDEAVRAIASRIILIAALFQLSDGAQVVTSGMLRGLGDTRSPLIGNLVGHWCVGLPVGLWLCFRLGWGLPGLWMGLSLGLTLVAAVGIAAWWIRVR